MKSVAQESSLRFWIFGGTGARRSVATAGAIAASLMVGLIAPSRAQASFMALLPGGDTSFTYGILEGGTNLQINNAIVNGNIGIKGTGGLNFSSGTINGDVDFAASSGSAGYSKSGGTGPTAVNFGVMATATDLSDLTTLSNTLAGETGTALVVNVANNATQTVNANSGTLDSHGDYVFTLTSINLGNGATLIINGQNLGDSVVINVPFGINIGGSIQLTGGLTADQVLFNITGNSTFQTAGNNSGNPVTADFLDIAGNFQVDNEDINGRVFGGDGGNDAFVSGGTLNAPPSETIPSAPEPGSLILGTSGALLLALGSFRKHLPRKS